MIGALVRTIEQLNDPAIVRVVWRAALLALAVLVALALGAGFALSQVSLIGWDWLDLMIEIAGGVGTVALAFLLFPITMGLIISQLLDDVAQAVERRHYPSLGPVRDQGIGEALGIAIRFTLMMLGLNLLAMVLAYWVPGLNLVVFTALNGYLIGREFFELVGVRRLPAAEVGRLRRRHRVRLLLAGMAIALPSTIPVVNLLMPVIATVFMVHMFQGVTAGSSATR